MAGCMLIVVIIYQLVAADKQVVEEFRGSGDSKIVGGRDVLDIREYPFIVNILEDNLSVCAGCILTPLFVVTACHCLAELPPEGQRGDASAANLEPYSFVAGSILRELKPDKSRDSQTRAPKAFHVHPKCYSLDGPTVFDLALGEMKSPFVVNDYVKPVALPTFYAVRFEQERRTLLENKSTVCEVAGWGLIKDYYFSEGEQKQRPEVLKVVRMYPFSEKKCLTAYTFLNYSLQSFYQMCAVSKYLNESDCQGDSGAPFFCNRLLIGVVSFGAECGTSSPSVYQLITPLYEWILQAFPDLAKTLDIQRSPDARQASKVVQLPGLKEDRDQQPYSRSSYRQLSHMEILLVTLTVSFLFVRGLR